MGFCSLSVENTKSHRAAWKISAIILSMSNKGHPLYKKGDGRNYIGARSGKLLVVKQDYAILTCRCDCGREHVVHRSNLARTRSCGCFRSPDYSGKRVGRLLVLSRDLRTPSGWLWKCLCDCGNLCLVKVGNLTVESTRSCGCLKTETLAKRNVKHGMLPRRKRSSEMDIFNGAKARCTNPRAPAFKHYGARGIEFRFTDFRQFIDTVGLRPSPQHSLDRIDNDGYYEPGNVRWATHKEQHDNQFRRCLACRTVIDGNLATFAGWGMAQA